MPICTPDAPSAKAAATPRASAMPPAAITGTFTASAICGTSAKVPILRGDVGLEEHAAMTAGFRALGDDGVDAAFGEPDRFLDARGGAQDFAAGRFDALEECRRRQAEMKADDRRPQLLDQRAGSPRRKAATLPSAGAKGGVAPSAV